MEVQIISFLLSHTKTYFSIHAILVILDNIKYWLEWNEVLSRKKFNIAYSHTIK